MLPVSLLDPKLRLVRALMVEVTGMVEASLLVFKAKLCKLERQYSCVGIAEDKQLDDISRRVAAARRPNSVGIEPTSLLPIRTKFRKEVRAPKEVGIVPVNLAFCRVRIDTPVSWPIELGIVPVRDVV